MDKKKVRHAGNQYRLSRCLKFGQMLVVLLLAFPHWRTELGFWYLRLTWFFVNRRWQMRMASPD